MFELIDKDRLKALGLPLEETDYTDLQRIALTINMYGKASSDIDSDAVDSDGNPDFLFMDQKLLKEKVLDVFPNRVASRLKDDKTLNNSAKGSLKAIRKIYMGEVSC